MLQKKFNVNPNLCSRYFLIDSDLENNRSSETKLLILDRDGVLIQNFDYVNDFERVIFKDTAIEKILEFQADGWRLSIATNQSGVARSLFSEEECVNFNFELCERLYDLFGLRIELLLYCPSHPLYSKDCNCRKPKSKLIDATLESFNCKKSSSLFIGDKVTDEEAATNANIDFIYVWDFESKS